MNKRFYYMEELDSGIDEMEVGLLIICSSGEARSLYGMNVLANNNVGIEKILLLQYSNIDTEPEMLKTVSEDKIEKIVIDNDQLSFIRSLKASKFLNQISSMIIDISSMKTLDVFLLLRYLDITRPKFEVKIINTIPYDYVFIEKPFTSYRSYIGDLKINEIIGYGGTGTLGRNPDLYIFMGFEGTQSLKVTEEISYHRLYLVNTVPSYYQKYKDICVINNKNVISTKSQKLMYVPADNPFEIYNLLEQHVGEREVCIAPLSTKPISLGICLYALEHKNVRIVYPTSKVYRNKTSVNVHKSFIYKIRLGKATS